MRCLVGSWAKSTLFLRRALRCRVRVIVLERMLQVRLGITDSYVIVCMPQLVALLSFRGVFSWNQAASYCIVELHIGMVGQ